MSLMKILSNVAVLSSFILFSSSFTLAQDKSEEGDSEAALAAANAKFVEVLDNTSDLFYKAVKRENGTTYAIKWEQDGEVSNILMNLRELGTYGEQPVYGLLAYTVVAESEKAFPPAVIKMVVVKTDSCGVGGFTMPESFDSIYLQSTIPSDTLTPAQVWMTCAYLHLSRIEARKEIAEILGAASK